MSGTAGSTQVLVSLLNDLGNAPSAARSVQLIFRDGTAITSGVSNTATAQAAANLAKQENVATGKVLKDISTSAAEFARFSMDGAEGLARAAVEAAKIGGELKTVLEAADSLLKFESSLTAQFKAQVLTGRQINLDKATALMLDGKQAEAMAEITAEVGETKDLGILERQALDELLGGKLTQLEQAQGLSEISTQESTKADKALADLNSNNELTARQIELANAAATEFERGKNAVIIQKEAMMALSASTLETTGVARGLAQMQQLLSVLATVTAVANIFGGFGKLGPLGIAGAVAATAGLFVAITSAKSQVTSLQDGMIDSDGGLMVSGPKGTFQLDKDDDVIAGTDLRSGSGNKSGGMDKLLAKMDALIAAAVSNKTISVDGYQLNEAVHLEKIPSGLA